MAPNTIGAVRAREGLLLKCFVLVCAAACSSTDPRFVTTPVELEGASIVFPVTVSREGARILKLHPAIDVGAKGLARFEVDSDEEATLLFLLLDEEAIRSTGVVPAPRPAAEHLLLATSEGCERGRLGDGGTGLRLRLPTSRATRLLALTAGASEFRGAVPDDYPALEGTSVELPIAGSSCPLAGRAEIEAFDSDAPLLIPEDATVYGVPALDGAARSPMLHWNASELLDETRLIGSSPHALFHVRRGARYRDQPGHRLAPREVLGLPSPAPSARSEWRWAGVKAAPRGDATPRQALALVRETDLGSGEALRSALAVIDIGEEGFEVAVTSTIVADVLRAFVVDETGSILALGSTPVVDGEGSGVLFHAPSLTGPWLRTRLAAVRQGNVLIRTLHPTIPHLAGFADGELLIGDLAGAPESAWLVRTSVGITRTGQFQSLASWASDRGHVFWAADNKGNFFRGFLPGETLEHFALRAPPELWSCGKQLDTCGWPLIEHWTTALAPIAEGTGVAMGLLNCEHVAVVRTDDLCTSALDLPPSRMSEAEQHRLQRYGSRLYVSRRSSEVYVVASP